MPDFVVITEINEKPYVPKEFYEKYNEKTFHFNTWKEVYQFEAVLRKEYMTAFHSDCDWIKPYVFCSVEEPGLMIFFDALWED